MATDGHPNGAQDRGLSPLSRAIIAFELSACLGHTFRMDSYAVLFRGINVGGKNKVSMSDLKGVCSAVGLESPKTLLQSGSVACRCAGKSASQLEGEIGSQFRTEFGYSVMVHVRSLEELRRVIAGNPFVEEARSDPSHFVGIFLAESPETSDVLKVKGAITGRERIEAGLRVVYAWYPDGIGESKLDRTPGWSKLVSDGTARNWNTILKLEALCAAVADQ